MVIRVKKLQLTYIAIIAMTLIQISCTNKTSKTTTYVDVSSDSASVKATSTTAEAPTGRIAGAEQDVAIITDFLNSIYHGNGLSDIFEDEWVYQHCSPRMQKTLRNEYEYDGEGWGSWLIGGWAAGEDIETKMTGITYDGSYYYATFKPTGESRGYVAGKRIIRFEVELIDGIPVINDCKWTRDFKYEW